MRAVKPMGHKMKRLFLFASVATALNASIAGCAAQSGATPNYSQVISDTSAAATLIDGIAGLLAGQNAAPVATVPSATAPVAASAPK